MIYLAVFTYLADWYVPLRIAQSTICLIDCIAMAPLPLPPWLARVSAVSIRFFSFRVGIALTNLKGNFMGFVFPLFTTQMYNALTFRNANIVFACIALLMAPIPFVVSRYSEIARSASDAFEAL